MFQKLEYDIRSQNVLANQEQTSSIHFFRPEPQNMKNPPPGGPLLQSFDSSQVGS